MIRCLATTPRGLFLVDSRDGCELVYNGHVYGLTWDQRFIYLFERVRNNTSTKMLVLSKNFEVVEEIHLSMIKDHHQVHLDPKSGFIGIANTHQNRVEFFNPYTKDIEAYNWTPVAGADYNHINSAWHDGECWWSCEHNKKHHPSKVVQLPNNRLNKPQKWTVASQIHNVYVEGDFIYTTVSLTSEIAKFSMAEDKIIQSKSFERNFPRTYSRGLARCNGFFLMGASRHCGREQRKEIFDSWIIKMDDDFKSIDSICIPKANQIYEVRALDEVDKAHNGIIL
jgi:hypothetical protein